MYSIGYVVQYNLPTSLTRRTGREVDPISHLARLAPHPRHVRTCVLTTLMRCRRSTSHPPTPPTQLTPRTNAPALGN